jgi:hypothetical protein
VWLPALALFAIVGGLGAPVLFVRIFPDQAAPALGGSIELERWTLSALVTPDGASILVEIEFIAQDQGNMVPPPWPSVSAFMREHRMTERAQTRALGSTRFETSFVLAMAGAWTVEIEADGNTLQIPVTVR